MKRIKFIFMSDSNNKVNSRTSRTKNYLIYLLIVLIFVNVLDAYSTNYINTFPSKIIAEFLTGYSEAEAYRTGY